ncbi:MAG: ankyrin repeat domain-containing protein, partial [Gallionella sp.]
LEQQFPRVLKKIVEWWDTPDVANYLYELMVDSRGGTRQGFPSEVASDIFNLQKVYNIQHVHQDEASNVWGEIPEHKRLELEKKGYTTSLRCFVRAVEAGDEEAVTIFLSSGVDLEVRDERYWTPLIITAFHGNDPLASMFLRYGAKVQAQDRNGYTPLHWGAFNGHTRVVELLLKHGAEVNATSQFGWTALMQAATRGHVPTVTKLLVHGADVNGVTADGWTALHKAAANGNGEIVLQLLEKGADRSIAYPDGSTALSLASKNNHDKIVRLLRSFRPIKSPEN